MNEEEQVEVSVGQSDGAAEGGITDGAQHLGALLDATIEAGVSADGGSNKELGSVMTMVVLSDGELTLVRRSKRNANVDDVDSLEKAEKRVAVKNLEETQGNAKK
jgi:ferredoxin-fold anticodon binding domain-containing protein